MLWDCASSEYTHLETARKHVLLMREGCIELYSCRAANNIFLLKGHVPSKSLLWPDIQTTKKAKSKKR